MWIGTIFMQGSWQCLLHCKCTCPLIHQFTSMNMPYGHVNWYMKVIVCLTDAAKDKKLSTYPPSWRCLNRWLYIFSQIIYNVPWKKGKSKSLYTDVKQFLRYICTKRNSQCKATAKQFWKRTKLEHYLISRLSVSDGHPASVALVDTPVAPQNSKRIWT